VTGDPAVLTRLALKVVVYPDLALRENLTDSASVALDGHEVPVELLTDLSAEIVREYEAAKPKIIGSAFDPADRPRGRGRGTRASLRKSDETTRSLAALATEAALVALDKPDTRPGPSCRHIYMFAASASARAGNELHVTLQGKTQQSRVIPVDVPSGGFTVAGVIEPDNRNRAPDPRET